MIKREVYEGKHQPTISNKIFDKVQEVLKQRGQIRHKDKNDPQPYCGLLKCGNCQMMVTGEYKIKKQKNGNIHYYTYYRCTRKSKTTKCKESPIRQEILDQQISSLLQKFYLKKNWATKLREMLEKDKLSSVQSSAAFVQENKDKIKDISAKLQRLLDGYLDQDIDKEVYREEKTKLLLEKKSLEEQITRSEQKRLGWIEPMADG